MKFRALGTFGLLTALAVASTSARAQTPSANPAEEEEESATETGKSMDAQPDAATSLTASASTGKQPEAAGQSKASESSAEVAANANATPTGSGASAWSNLRPPVFGERGDWFIQPYGYARFDAIEDSTQSFEDGYGPYLIQRVGTYRGDHRRSIFTARDSRLGLAIGAPDFQGIKTSAQIELDFYGLQVTDAKKHDQVVMGPVRLRHAYVKIETSVVDVIAGQYFDVFGWGSTFYPATVAYLGVPGQVYHRNPQLRVEKKLRAGNLEVHAALAAMRAGQRDSGGIPDPQAGLKISHHGWSGISQAGMGRAAVVPFALGVSGLYRRFEVPEFRPEPGSQAQQTQGYGLMAQALLPLVPAKTLEKKGNSLTVSGEFSLGTGIADMYTGMDGGSRFPLLPNPSLMTLAQVYPQNIDPGLVTFDGRGLIKSINWKAFMANAQYYLPISNGRVWISGTYSRIWSDNIRKLTPAVSWGSIFTKMEYIDANLGWDITPALTAGLSFQTLKQSFGDYSAPTPNFGSTGSVPGTGGVAATARNNRGMFSMAFFF
jgi:hypothetical protein